MSTRWQIGDDPMNRWTAAVIAWVGVIFFSSTSLALHLCESGFTWATTLVFGTQVIQHPSYNVWHLLADKGLHVTLFAVLGLLLWQAIPDVGWKPRRGLGWKPLCVLGLGLVVGSCSEYLQSFFPDRDPALRDVLINVCGTALGIALSLWIQRTPSSTGRNELVKREK
jgi:VanZ family protein